MSYSYLPPLSTVLKPKDLPAELNFLNVAVDALFGDIYLKEYQVSANHNFASIAYYAVLTSYRKIGIEIPGTGLMLILNPQFDESQPNSSTEIPVSVNFDWPIKRVLQSFNLENFASDPLSFLDLIQDYLGLSDTDIMESYVSRHIPFSDIQTVVSNINSHYNLSPAISVVTTGDFLYDINELSTAIYLNTQLHALNKNPSQIIKDVYLSGIPGVSELKNKVNSIFHSEFGKDSIESIKKLLVPNIEARIILSAGLEIPRSILVPLDANGNPIMPQNPTDPLPKTILKFVESEFTFSTYNGIGFDKELALSLLPQLSRIGNTPLTIGFTYAKLDFSRTTNIPEAELDGRPKDFVGVYIREATIGFPAFWNHDAGNSNAFIKGRNLLIGTGGFSGILSLESSQAPGSGAALFRLGDPGNTGKHFQLGLTQFLIQFKQNAIVQSEIRGYMKIPNLKDANNNDAQLDVLVHIGNNGDFRITVSEADGIVLRIPNVLDIIIKSLSIGTEDGKWYIEASGSLLITASIPGVEVDFLKQPIDIKSIRIWQDGSIEFPGGGITLPTQMHLKVGPVSLALDHIGFGSHEGTYQNVKRQYSYFGFNGQLNTGPSGVDVRGDGVEFHFTRDSGPFHSYLRIAGIGIDIKIPANATEESADILIKGYLAMRSGNDFNGNPMPTGPEYQGSVSLNIKPLKIAAKASMNMRPKVPAYIVDVELDLATPLPLGPTGLGIYGFRGLVGSHYVASKPFIDLNENDSWFEYLKKKVPPRNKQGIGIEKFDPALSGFSLGVGASIATMGDDGWAFSSKVFIMISMPEMLLIEGQANALHKRLGIESEQDPPFYAFIVIDKNSVQAGLGVNYKLPDNGEILSLRGEMQLGFFFNNSSAWYINIGKDLPEDKRVQARLFTLFNAYAYLMLSSQGIRAGAGAKFEMQKRFGPVKVGLYAFIDTKGFISFKPVQIGGSIVLGGGVYIKVGRFGIELHVTAGLSAEAPKPFIISGFVQIKIKIVFVKIRIKLEFTWIFNPDLNTSEVRLIDTADFVALPDNVAMYPFKAINMLSSEAFKLKFLGFALPLNPETDNTWNSFVIPMDSFVDIEFKRPVKPYNLRFGGGVNPLPQFTEYISPQKARMPQVKHVFTVEKVEIKIWNRANLRWDDYNMWEALTKAFQNGGLTVNTETYDYGYWQYNNVPGKYTSLRLLSQSPFSVSNGVAPENFGIHSQMILCQGQAEKRTCQYWNQVPVSKIYEPGVILADRKLKLLFTALEGSIGSMPNVFGIDPSLKVHAGNMVEIFLKEPMVSVDLRLTALPGVRIDYYSKVFSGTTVSGLPAYSYQLVSTVNYAWNELTQLIHYEDANTPVSKIVITVNDCPDGIEEIFNAYWTMLLEMWMHGGDATEPWQQDQITYWLHLYGSGGGGGPTMEDLDTLCKEWKEIIHGGALLNMAETEAINYWFENFCARRTDIGAFLILCKMWTEMVLNPQSYPTLYPYAIGWKSAYCNGGGHVPTEFDRCGLYVHEVCWMNEKDWEFNILLQQNNQSVINVGMNSLSQAINQALPPVWRPDSYFAVVVSTKDKVTAPGTSTNISHDGKFAIGFKTAGTLGFFHKTQQQYLDLEAQNKADQYKLANLRHYIDYQRSYPDAEGKLVGAKPLYYKNPKLGIFFIKPYVYEFFTKWDEYKGNPVKEYQLQSVIRDPIDKPGDPPVVPAEIIGWQLRIGAQAIPIDAFDIETISNILVQGNPNCTGITNILKPPTMNAEVQRNYDIKPQKLYTAIFKALEINTGGNQESVVHSYTFQTSRYGNFIEHIESYIRRSTDPDTGQQYASNAFFPVVLERNTAALATLNSKLLQTLAGTLPATDPLIGNFASVYDRIVSGILELKALQAATGTELNIIKTRNTDNNAVTIIGILVKSPEPFNDPKLPLSELANTLRVTDPLNTGAQFIYVFAKDNSSIFITNAAQSLPLHTLNLAFTHVKYNGIVYASFETVNVPVNLNI